MPRHSIDYLNARRDAKPASGGTRQIKLGGKAEERRRADAKASFAAHDAWEQALLQCDALRAEFRSWVANLRPVESIMSGETDADLEF